MSHLPRKKFLRASFIFVSFLIDYKCKYSAIVLMANQQYFFVLSYIFQVYILGKQEQVLNSQSGCQENNRIERKGIHIKSTLLLGSCTKIQFCLAETHAQENSFAWVIQSMAE